MIPENHYQISCSLNCVKANRDHAFFCLQERFPTITTVNINSLNTDSSRVLAGVYLNLGGVKRVAKGHEVRGPKGREREWDSWGGGQPAPSPPARGSGGSAVSCPRGVQGGAPAAKRFYHI